MFSNLVKSRVMDDFLYYKTVDDFVTFECIWFGVVMRLCALFLRLNGVCVYIYIYIYIYIYNVQVFNQNGE